MCCIWFACICAHSSEYVRTLCGCTVVSVRDDCVFVCLWHVGGAGARRAVSRVGRRASPRAAVRVPPPPSPSRGSALRGLRGRARGRRSNVKLSIQFLYRSYLSTSHSLMTLHKLCAHTWTCNFPPFHNGKPRDTRRAPCVSASRRRLAPLHIPQRSKSRATSLLSLRCALGTTIARFRRSTHFILPHCLAHCRSRP